MRSPYDPFRLKQPFPSSQSALDKLNFLVAISLSLVYASYQIPVSFKAFYESCQTSSWNERLSDFEYRHPLTSQYLGRGTMLGLQFSHFESLILLESPTLSGRTSHWLQLDLVSRMLAFVAACASQSAVVFIIPVEAPIFLFGIVVWALIPNCLSLH